MRKIKKKKKQTVRIEVTLPDQLADQLFALQSFYSCPMRNRMVENLIFRQVLEIGGGLEPAGLTPVQRKAFLYCQNFVGKLLDASAPLRCMKLLLKPEKKWSKDLELLFGTLSQCQKKQKKSKRK